MPPLIHLKLNNIIDLSCLISPSLVTDNVGFNRIKYEYSLCRWQIDYEMKSKSVVPCVMRELSWQNSCIRVPQSEWTSHRHNFNVFMYLVYFSFIFRNGTILTVSQRVAIEIWRRVVRYAANDTPGNPYIAHPYPQLTTPTRISLEKSFPETISGPAPESPWQLSLPWPVAAHTISLCIWRVKRKQCTFLNLNKRHSKWLPLKPGHQWRMPYRYIFGFGMSQEETVRLFEFEQASFEMTSIETWTPVPYH